MGFQITHKPVVVRFIKELYLCLFNKLFNVIYYFTNDRRIYTKYENV